MMLSLRTMLDRKGAEGMAVSCNFVIGDAAFTAHLEDGGLSIRRGAADVADLSFRAPSARALAALFYGDVPPEAVGITATGNAETMRRFIGLFNLPPKAGGVPGPYR